jgi:hypothetical protein
MQSVRSKKYFWELLYRGKTRWSNSHGDGGASRMLSSATSFDFHVWSFPFFLAHLTWAALLAISRRCSEFSLSARARPPRRPRWTA